MTRKIINWGILGTSYISEVMAAAIQQSSTSQLFAIASRSNSTAKLFADKFAIPHLFDDYQAMLECKEIDAIYIGLPNHLHKEWIIRAALSGKHILCEKPFVISANEAQEVISVVQQAKVFCMEALMYRCHPVTHKLQEIIQSKVLGDIKLYTATYTANIADKANPTAGGSIRNLGCYPVSLVRLLANKEPVSIQASGRMNPITNTDNQASAILKFEDNSIAVISTADDIKMSWQFEIHGTEGCLKMITNPWLPSVNNQFLLHLNHEDRPLEVIVSADLPLYTYQINTVNNHIINNSISGFGGVTLKDSLGNITVLEKWLNLAKASVLKPELMECF